MAGPLTVISLFWYGSAHWQVTPSLSLISFTNSHVLYFFISFIFSLFLHSNAANILMFLILIPWYLFSVHILFRLNSDLAGYKFGTTSDGKPGYIVPGGADTVIPFNRVINVTGEVMGNRVTISLGFHPDLLYVEFGSQYEVKRLYSIYSGDVDSVIVNNDGFIASQNC